jgi:hypothetical protein
MIIQEEHDLLTQTSAGTPCGELDAALLAADGFVGGVDGG